MMMTQSVNVAWKIMQNDVKLINLIAKGKYLSLIHRVRLYKLPVCNLRINILFYDPKNKLDYNNKPKIYENLSLI